MAKLAGQSSNDPAHSESSGGAPPLPLSLNIKLSVMMFLQYAIWGAWLPLFFTFVTKHRGIDGERAGTLMALSAVGALLAPFFAGQLADRFLNTEKFLGLSHLVGAGLIWGLASAESYVGLLGFGVAYSLAFAPTLSLTNSLAFHHLPDRNRDFGRVRVWGTIGWIAVGIGMGQYLLHYHTPPIKEAQDLAQAAGMGDALRLSAILSVVLGVFCFFLPATPPQEGKSKFAAGEAIKEFGRQPLLALFLIAFPISIIHDYYYVLTGDFLTSVQNSGSETAEAWAKAINSIFGVGGGGLMTIGQIAEIAVLAAMPFVAKRLSRKTLLSIGVAAYAVRFGIFAYMPTLPALVPALMMHGLCFGCFYFVAFMVVDENTTHDVRASAQTVFNFMEVGLGTIVGHFVAGWMVARGTAPGGHTDYRFVFGVPMWVAVGCLLAMLVFYPGGRGKTVDAH